MEQLLNDIPLYLPDFIFLDVEKDKHLIGKDYIKVSPIRYLNNKRYKFDKLLPVKFNMMEGQDMTLKAAILSEFPITHYTTNVDEIDFNNDKFPILVLDNRKQSDGTYKTYQIMLAVFIDEKYEPFDLRLVKEEL